MSNYPITAVFCMSQLKTPKLIMGSLSFYQNGNTLLTVKATSGLAGYQYRGAHVIDGKGCIPPLREWKIDTNGYQLTDGDLFFPLSPDPYEGRSGLTLHGNTERHGSAEGIIVQDLKQFNNEVVPLIQTSGQKEIHLSVVYVN